MQNNYAKSFRSQGGLLWSNIIAPQLFVNVFPNLISFKQKSNAEESHIALCRWTTSYDCIYNDCTYTKCPYKKTYAKIAGENWFQSFTISNVQRAYNAVQPLDRCFSERQCFYPVHSFLLSTENKCILSLSCWSSNTWSIIAFYHETF